MKKNILLICLPFLLPFLIEAQVNFGIKAGGNYSTLSESGEFEVQGQKVEFYTYLTGYHTGVFSEVNLSPTMGLRVELLYNLIGAKQESISPFDRNGRLEIEYLNLPLLVKLRPLSMWSIDAGGVIGFLLNENDYLHFFDSATDMSLAFGTTVRFLNHFGVSARYVHGLTSISKMHFTDMNGNPIQEEKSKNRSFQLSLEFYFKK